MNRVSLILMLTLLLMPVTSLSAAEDDGGIDGVTALPTPSVSASLAVGFNYDYLRNPLSRSFTDSRGVFSVNIPIPFSMSDEMMADIMQPVSDNFTDGEYFVPDIKVKQFANTTIMVDVPMLGGVCSFNHVRMLNINYSNTFDLQGLQFAPADSTLSSSEDDQISLLLNGALNVPLNFSLGWETVSFGYLKKLDMISEHLKAGLTLTRHQAFFDVNGDVDIDLLGSVDAVIQGQGLPHMDLDYNLQNTLDGFYTIERWTPTLSLQYRRFYHIARFGFKDKAEGRLIGDYSVPFFVDPETFQFNDSLLGENAPTYMMDHLDEFTSSATNNVRVNTTNDMDWEMPHGFTFGVEIVPEKLKFSYTKFKNRIGFKLFEDEFDDEGDYFQDDSLDFNVSAAVDHMFLLSGDFKHFYFTGGIFSFDVGSGDDQNILLASVEDPESNLPGAIFKFGDGIAMPVANGGIIIGNRFQFMGEIDLLPFPSMKTGIIYKF